MGKDGKKKSKRESKSRDDDGGAEPQGTVAVSVKVVRENSNTSGSVLACFTDAPAPGDLLDQDAEPYEFQCEQAGGARALTGQKVRGARGEARRVRVRVHVRVRVRIRLHVHAARLPCVRTWC